MTYVVCLCLAQHATLHEWCHWIMCYDCYDSVMTQLWPFRFVFRHACYELLVLDTAISGLALPIWVILCDMAYYWRHDRPFKSGVPLATPNHTWCVRRYHSACGRGRNRYPFRDQRWGSQKCQINGPLKCFPKSTSHSCLPQLGHFRSGYRWLNRL